MEEELEDDVGLVVVDDVLQAESAASDKVMVMIEIFFIGNVGEKRNRILAARRQNVQNDVCHFFSCIIRKCL